MKQKLLKTLVLLCALIAGGNLTASAAENVTTTYTFTSKSWEATPANWSGDKDGNQFNTTQTPKGVQITTLVSPVVVTSPKSFSNVKEVIVTYSSTSKGVGSIAVSVGSKSLGSKTISKSQTETELSYTASNLTGNVSFTVTCTTNSFAINSIKIVEAGTSVEAPVISPVDGTTFTGTQSVTITQADSKPVYYTTDGSTPTKSSTLYTGAFDVAASAETGKVTVNAIAYDGEEASAIVSATYTDTSIQPLNVAFTFNNALFGTSYSGSVNKATIEAAGGKVTGTVKNVQVEYALGTGSYFYLKDSEIRVYEGNTLTFTAPTGYNITKIVFTGAATLTYNGSDLSSKTWSGEDNSVEFGCSSNGTVLTAAVTLDRALPLVATLGDLNVTALEKDATGTFSTTVTPATGLSDSDYTLSWAATPAGLTVADNGAYTADSRGTYTVTATATSNNPSSYKDASKEYTVTVSAPVEVTASNVEMTYGDAAKAIGATASANYAGTLSYASENPAVATVDASGNVTAVAAGTTTITITSAADAEHLYLAGVPVAIDVTVNAPAGKTTMTAEEYYLYYEKIIGNGTNFPTGWTGDGVVWNVHNTYGAQTGTSTSGIGTSGETYDLVTCDYDLSGYTGWVLDFDHTGKTFSNPSNACKVFIQEGTNTPVQLNIEYFGGSNFTWKEVRNIDIDAYQDKTVHFIFRYTPTSGNDGKWQVKNFGVYGEYKKITATLNTNGYATICSEYPLNFSEAADYSAWQVTRISGDEITFEQIKGDVKGGTGLLLMGTPSATVTLKSVDSSNDLSGNKLEGTLAPTYVAAGEYYGLKGKEFVKVNAGTVPAGKALLPANLVGSGVKALSFKFDGADGISEIMSNGENEKMSAIYDLSGRRVVKPTKGLYIVNGKKVVK